MQSLIDNQWLQVIRKGLSLELPLDQEKHSAHEAVTLEVRALPKAGFSSSMETLVMESHIMNLISTFKKQVIMI